MDDIYHTCPLSVVSVIHPLLPWARQRGIRHDAVCPTISQRGMDLLSAIASVADFCMLHLHPGCARWKMKLVLPQDEGARMKLPKTYLVQMRNAERYLWWKPILALLLALLFYCVLAFVMPFAVWRLTGIDLLGILPAEAGGPSLQSLNGSLDGIDPFTLGILCGSIICMLPCIGLSFKICGLGGLRGLSSVEGHLRWKRIGRLFLPMLAVFVLGTAIEMAATSFFDGMPTFQLPSTELLLVILILVPLQSLTEEYVFRGALMQVLGSWIPVAIIPVVLQALLFMMCHGYNLYGLISTGLYGIIAGIIVLQTGGLEAAISIHAANNVAAFLAAALIQGTNALASDATPQDLAIGFAIQLAAYAVAYRISKKRGWLAADSPKKAKHFRQS